MTTLALENERRLLYNALATEGFRFILIVQHHPSVYREIRDALIEQFGQRRKIQEFSFRQKSPSDVREAIRRLGSGILLMRDVEYLLQQEGEELRVYFNQRRDLLGRHDIAFVFFLEPASLQLVPKLLPDWWSLRSLELEFTAPSDTLPILETGWGDVRETSPYASWTQEQRNAEIARLKRLIADADAGNVRLLARLHADLAEVLQYSHQPEAAMEIYQKSLTLATQARDQALIGEVLNNIGHIYHTQGDYDTAQRYLEEALATHQTIGNLTGKSITLINLAEVARMKGDYDTALSHLEQALTICRNTNDRQGESIALNNISQIYQARGNSETALQYLEQALAIQQQIGDRLGEGATLNNMSRIAQEKGDFDAALRFLQQSLGIQQRIGNRLGEGTVLNNMGQIYSDLGDYDKALRYLEQALALRLANGDRKGESYTLNNLAVTAYARGDYDAALRYWEQALSIQQQIGDAAGQAATLTNLGVFYWEQQQDAEKAIPALVQVHQILQQLGSPNARHPAEYLEKIRQAIGEARFRALAGM